MAKIDIISGFLGAGKTTLIKKLIKEVFVGQKVVLIENEFGEIGIDGGFLKDAGIEITEMNSGCICCSLVGDFGRALKKVVEEYHPDHILIEPSGVGKLSDVRRAIEKEAEECSLEIGSLVTVADVKKVRMYMKNFGEFYNNQIESAGTIILSRTQFVDQKKLDEAIEMIRGKNPDATIITTPWDQLSGKTIHDAMEKSVSLADQLMAEYKAAHPDEDEEDDDECCGHDHEHHHDHDDHDHDDECCGHDHEHHHDHDDHDHDHDGACCGHDHHHHHHHHGHDADEVFTSWGRETAKKYSDDQIRSILKTLSESDENSYGIILRAKGMVPRADGTWINFDMVPEESEVRDGAADYTGRLCVIGSKLNEEKIAELFGV
ncbi:CobW family GTP-binding protein [Porcincola intestinalis]|uniref:CobW family GTP-binding protein n=1 Tax=Porcincola intestinalis TaxID=2606632 RepID=UPI0023F56C7E|nr:CobW family GTP-binding protein [Porcincola intestinalis]MCI6767991.1 CobW family GTP-binding protein [Lachnospiraceae bacterium]MDD7061146.1 GTP-binding protein [Porcincola intestinalis]MDY4204379.1 CobW family GTP-binding protein [Porcincola intestinalis]MDY5283498.1 CobW family GTP-binding protein [Porcincola intestinalis]